MSNTSITYLVGACAAVFSLAVFVGLVVVPACAAYRKPWERAAAAFLSLYVLLSVVALGALAGGTAVYLWDRIGG